MAALRAHPLKPDSASTCSQAVWLQSPWGSPLYPDVSVWVPRWAQKQESWRFQKTRQTWLLMHMYDEDKVCTHGWAKKGGTWRPWTFRSQSPCMAGGHLDRALNGQWALGCPGPCTEHRQLSKVLVAPNSSSFSLSTSVLGSQVCTTPPVYAVLGMEAKTLCSLGKFKASLD